MRIEIDALTIDTPDPEALATFYEGLLGWTRTFEDDGEVMIASPTGEGFPILFLENDDEKVAKNRLHFDLRPDDQQAALAHALALGATHVDIGQHEDEDVTWIVLADPDGNEFCILSETGELTVDPDELVAAGGVAVTPQLGVPQQDLLSDDDEDDWDDDDEDWDDDLGEDDDEE